MRSPIRYILPVFLLILLVGACKKKTPDNIGLPFLPDSDVLGAEFTDTLELITHTVKDDSLRTDEVTTLLLGVVNDPVFGVTKSSVFSQFVLSKTNPSFGTNPVLDSAVLSLVYNNRQYYGTLEQVKFHVYEVTEAMKKESNYYSDQIVAFGTQLGSAYIKPSVTDSVQVDTLKYPPHLRIHLDKAFFQDFISNPTFYSSNSTLQTKFKGVHVATSSGTAPGQGAILYMDMVHTYSRLTLFYHNSTDTTSYHFPISKDCARFTHFEHDYSGATNVLSQLNSSPSSQEATVYVQAMAGVRTMVTLPGLKDMFGGKKVAINKAELVIPIDPLQVDSPFTQVNKMVVTIADSIPLTIPDYNEGATYFGGDYDADNKEYRLNIARYVQQVIDGKRELKPLYLFPKDRAIVAQRVVLKGGSKANSVRMKLKIAYTPLD